MPVYLKAQDDKLAVTLGGLEKAEFSDALARVKSIPGRRWNPDGKVWEFPKDADTAMRIVQMLEPVPDAETKRMIQEHTAEVAESLVTKLPDDAELALPWADKLLPHQRAGIAWQIEHPHTLIADDMGLGKTAMILATWLEVLERWAKGMAQPLAESMGMHPEKSGLVVCPNGQRGQWAATIEVGPRDRNREPIIEEWPDLTAVIIDGNAAKRKAALDEPADFYVVNWEKLRLMPELAERDWSIVIADEAHRAKSRKAQQTQALWKLDAPILAPMTGTPIMNSPDELWSILKWLRPEQYTSFWAFHHSYVDEYPTRHGNVMTGVKNPDALRFELSDKMIRRTKHEVLKDLPAKLPPNFVPVELTKAERKLYEAAESELFLSIQAFVDSQEDVTLEDLADMPLDRLEGMVPNAAAALWKLRRITAAAKAKVADEIVRDNPERPFVVFTWLVDVAESIAESLSKGKPALEVGCIAGDSAPADEIAEAFQAGELDHVVCGIAKGGAGIDLYRSSHAIFVEEDWVPAINTQAEDRLHRQGQEDEVTITKLYCPDTVDDGKIRPANEFKQMITDQVLGG